MRRQVGLLPNESWLPRTITKGTMENPLQPRAGMASRAVRRKGWWPESQETWALVSARLESSCHHMSWLPYQQKEKAG